jgi:phosphatidylglycerophosphatase A
MSTADPGAPAAPSRLLVLLATAGGIGRLRPGPGTWATAAAGLAAWPLLAAAASGACPRALLTPLLLGAAALATLVGMASAEAACAHYRAADPSAVVIDEVAGTWLALAVMPPGQLAAAPLAGLLWAMALFRVFDIAKPPPVAWLERLPGATGIMADDLAAGVLAGMLATAVLH